MPRPYRCRLSLAFFLCIASSVLAQQPSTPSPPHGHPTAPPLQAVDQQQMVAYWTTETGWNSELQLRNNALSQELTVTPVLRLVDGAETSLGSVTIKPQEVVSIDIAAAISAAGATNLVGTYGSVVLRYSSPSQQVLYAALMVRRIGYPIAFHIDAIGESQAFQTGSREGIWWLPKDSTSDYLILTNHGSNTIPIVLSLYNSLGKESKQLLILGAFETRRYSVRKLAQAAGLTGSYGGIKVAATAHAGSLNTLHFLFDETAGFSAILKMFDYDPTTPLQERDYAHTGIWTQRAPMLALSNPDPALAFAPGTTLHPQLFIRNTTGKPANATLRFNWRTASTAGPAAGPALHLTPYETRLVDVAALQTAGTFPKEANWTSVTLTTTGLPGEVVAVAASYDSSLRYGAQTPFSDQLAFRWEGGMWEYDPYHNTIITAGNGGTKPTHAAFTIFYNQGVQRYDLEQTLQPDEQMWIDVGKLIREHIPDKNGDVLPAELTSGSYEFRDLTNKSIGALFEGKVIFDKTYGHVAYGCASCCGYTTVSLRNSPLQITNLAYATNGVNAYNACDNTLEDVSPTFYGNWKTVNGNIATVDNFGEHYGVAVGSTTSTTSGSLQSNKFTQMCPIIGHPLSGGDNVVAVPKFLQVVSNSCTTQVCQGKSWETNLYYRVLDSNEQPINVAGMVIKEFVSQDNGTCHSTINDSSQWLTDSTGTMTSPDSQDTCGGSNTCQVSFTQTFTVNGYGVLLLTQDKTHSGSHNVITTNCVNGICSCPTVVIFP